MNKRIEFSTLLGITVALALIGWAITLGGTGEILSFFDMPSVFIVIGGTFFVACASYTVSDVFRTVGTISRTMIYANADKRQIVLNCIKLAEQNKKEGLLSLQKLEDITRRMGPFFRKYMQLVIDGLSSAEIEKMMTQEIIAIMQRHRKSVDILRKAAETAPAMGLIGTLVGLVQMLGNLQDTSKIGPAMAVALLTTLYGAIIAYVVLIPLAAKLEKTSKEEIELLKIYAEAIINIAKGEGPVKLEMKMNAGLPPESRTNVYG